MATKLSKVISELYRTVANPQYSLSQLESFYYTDYMARVSLYKELDAWFTGAVLDEYIKAGKAKIQKFPIRINPIRGAALKHAYALFGEFPDDAYATLVSPKVKKPDGASDASTDHVEHVLKNIWAENNGTAMQMEGGIVAQIYGGCAFRVAYVPTLQTESKIQIELLKPGEFYGIPYANDPWSLREAWMIREIDWRVAEEYGVMLGTGGTGYYIEHWKPNSYEIFINDVQIGFVIDHDRYNVGATNPFGVVPFVYIPHVRYGKSFWGEGIITDAVKGLTREINARQADIGDAVVDDTHMFGIMSNVRGAPVVIEPAPGVRLLNIGSSQNIVGGEAQPTVTFPNYQKTSKPALEYVTELYNQFRREVNVPAVADGEDEGSQRSSLTLTTRMWPLVSHTKQERVFWATGLRIANRMILKILSVKGLMGIGPEHLGMEISNRWAPILPRDREQLVNELSVRASANLGSIEHLLDLTGDIDNVPLEVTRIKDWMTFVEQIGAKVVSEGEANTQKPQDVKDQKKDKASGSQ